MKEQELQSKEISRVFNVSRVLAIISVITAHTPFDIDNGVLLSLIKRFSSIGVVVFIIISGYYFNPQKYSSIGRFIKSKILTIFLPWAVMGSLVFFEAKLVMGQPVELLSWLKFLIGYKSYLYYLPILVICYLIYFYPVKNNVITPVCIISFLVTVTSQQLTAWGVIDANKFYLTNYMNIFNWLGYFCLGLFMKRISVYNLLKGFKRHIIPIVIGWIAVFVLAYYFDSATGYFSKFAMPLQILGAVVVFGICSYDIFDCIVTRYISRISFCVYLVHFAFVSVVDKFIGSIYILKLFMPLVTLSVIAIFLLVCEKVSQKLKLEKLFYNMSGIR